MKIQKDIRKDIAKDVVIAQTKTIETYQEPNEPIVKTEYDMQQTVDDIFADADAQIEITAHKSLRNAHPKISRWKLRIGWSFLGFVVFVVVGLSFMGYKTYKYAENRWPGIREEAINRFQELQAEVSGLDDNDLTVEAYYQKQYILVLSADDIRDITQLGLTLNQIQQLKDIAENNATTSTSLLDILPEEKAIEFIKIMIAEKKAKELGEVVYIDTITDVEVKQFLADMQEQQNLTKD